MIEIGGYSLAGNKYNDLNQDFLIKRHVFSPCDQPEEYSQPFHVVAVLDGHGVWGERASTLAGEAITEAMQEQLQQRRQSMASLAQSELQNIIVSAVEQGHQAAMKVYDNPPSHISMPLGARRGRLYDLHHDKVFGDVYICKDRVVPFECGTTCVVAIMQGDKYAVGYVGDSGAVLASETASGANGRCITPPHCFSSSAEVERVKQAGGEAVAVVQDKGEAFLRVLSGPGCGQEVMMSRALGHRSLASYGIRPIPDVTCGTFTKQDRCLILASDGVWDWVNPRSAAKLVFQMMGQGRSAQQAAEELCHMSVETALDDLDCLADNTTAMVIMFSENSFSDTEGSDGLPPIAGH